MRLSARILSIFNVLSAFLPVPEAGVEQPQQNTGEMPISETGGTPGGTVEPDSELQAVIQAWPELSAADRVAVARFVSERRKQPKGSLEQ